MSICQVGRCFFYVKIVLLKIKNIHKEATPGTKVAKFQMPCQIRLKAFNE